MTVQQTLADLVAIDSVSSRSNAAIIAYLQQRCENHDLFLETYPHVDERGETKFNLVARSGNQSELELVLVGHTDTVPYDSAWTDALNLTERDGKLLG